MKNILLAFAVSTVSICSHAGDLYGGVGFPGLTLGYGHPVSDSLVVRAEFSGGLSADKSGTRDGIDYVGSLKAQSIGGFVDWFPSSTNFRLTAGLTSNDTKLSLKSIANGSGNATLNGKTVSFADETFNIDVKYPSVTPYVGLGYGFKPNSGKGWGFYTDIGVLIGKFEATTTTSIVGKQGITQADVDAQTQKLRNDLNKLSVLPKLSIGARYSF